MSTLYDIFLVLHLVGWAIVLGGYFATIKQPGIYKGTLHGALTALISGIAMVGVAEMSEIGKDPSMVKIGIKLTIALIVTALAFFANNRGDKTPTGVKHAIGGLTVVNIIIAVFV